MPKSIPRVRMIAGPNGSGKSTLIEDLHEVVNFGHYLNADEIEKSLRIGRKLNLRSFDLNFATDDFRRFLGTTGLGSKSVKKKAFEHLSLHDNEIIVNAQVDSYDAAAVAQYLRSRFIKHGHNFSFETVMSHQSKLDLLKEAKKAGFRTYVYFIATESPVINIERVKFRVETGGHDVLESKITERYYRSLDLLLNAIRLSDRAYLFDNSTERYRLFAEITNGENLRIVNEVPGWFVKYIEEKLQTTH